MSKKIIGVAALLMVLLTVGMASAINEGPSINICTDNPDQCANTNTVLTVYKDIPADQNPGLHALFQNWDTNTGTYMVSIIDTDANPDVVVYGPIAGSIGADPQKVYYAWTPTKVGDGKYKAKAHAEQDPSNGLEANITVSTRPSVIPEVATVGLVGLGLVGMILLRRRSD